MHQKNTTEQSCAEFDQWKHEYVKDATAHGYEKLVCFACYDGEAMLPIIDGDLYQHWIKFHKGKHYPPYSEGMKQYLLDWVNSIQPVQEVKHANGV